MASMVLRRVLLALLAIVAPTLLSLGGNSLQSAYASGTKCPSGYSETYDTNNHGGIANIEARVDLYGCARTYTDKAKATHYVKRYFVSMWGPYLTDRKFAWRIWRCGTNYGTGTAQLDSNGHNIVYYEHYLGQNSTRTVPRPQQDWGKPLQVIDTGDIDGYFANGKECISQADTRGSSVIQGNVRKYDSIPGGFFYANVVHQD